MKQEISKTVLPILAVCQSLSSESCRMSGRFFHEAGTQKDCLAFFIVKYSGHFSVGPICPVHTETILITILLAILAQASF